MSAQANPRHGGSVPMNAWPSWREALCDAQKGVGTAYERRGRVFRAAHDAGLTFAQIADQVGLTAAGVHQIIGGRRKNVSLDDPAFVLEVKDA